MLEYKIKSEYWLDGEWWDCDIILYVEEGTGKVLEVREKEQNC